MDCEELPERLYRSTGPGLTVVHVDAECNRLINANGVRPVPAEYVRRAGARLCGSCGDGREL